MQVVRNSIFVATLVNVEVFADADCTLIGLFFGLTFYTVDNY